MNYELLSFLLVAPAACPLVRLRVAGLARHFAQTGAMDYMLSAPVKEEDSGKNHKRTRRVPNPES